MTEQHGASQTGPAGLLAWPVDAETALVRDIERLAESFPHHARVDSTFDEFLGRLPLPREDVGAHHPLPLRVPELVGDQLLKFGEAHAHYSTRLSLGSVS